jgi:hypothetical protein
VRWLRRRVNDERNFFAVFPKQCVHCVPVTHIAFNMSIILNRPFEQLAVPPRACFAPKEVLSHIVVDANDIEPLAGEVSHRRGADKAGTSGHNRQGHCFFL